MLKSLELRNFTAFKDAELKFAPGLNVAVGENGTGKSHILKVAYSAIYVSAKGKKDSGSENPTKGHLQGAVADKLNAVFRPDELGRLTSRNRNGRQRCEVNCCFSDTKQDLSFSFNTQSKKEVIIDNTPSAWGEKIPVYLPTRELLTIYPGFISLYETTQLPFEETWRDTCVLLGAPLLKGNRLKKIKEMLVPLEEAMGGRVELDKAGRFYLYINGNSIEIHLIAEGLRKLAMIARLIAAGLLIDKGYLFWDEPDSNLNPKIIKVVARTILHLCKRGIQVFVATHSLFLMREIDILLRSAEFQKVHSQFIGLHRAVDGIRVQQGSTVDDIGDIDALQEELSQSDRYLYEEAE